MDLFVGDPGLRHRRQDVGDHECGVHHDLAAVPVVLHGLRADQFVFLLRAFDALCVLLLGGLGHDVGVQESDPLLRGVQVVEAGGHVLVHPAEKQGVTLFVQGRVDAVLLVVGRLALFALSAVRDGLQAGDVAVVGCHHLQPVLPEVLAVCEGELEADPAALR